MLPWLLLLACSTPAPEVAPMKAPPQPSAAAVAPSGPSARQQAELAYWPTRTDLELDGELRATCAASLRDGKPLLLSFSAPWCPDCRRVRDLEAEPVLKAEQDEWHKLVVHVGQFDRHTLLRAAFSVSKIVTWVALQPTDCQASPDTWPVLHRSVFEPATGSGPKTAESLASWLKDARKP